MKKRNRSFSNIYWRRDREVSEETPWARAIEAQVARYVAPAQLVLHELKSTTVHVDVQCVAPGVGHPYWLLFTTGMSALPMTMPDIAPGSRYAELSMLLPPVWHFDREAMQQRRWSWPVHWLRSLARLPHEHATWLGEGHSIPNGSPIADPLFPGTELSGFLVVTSPTLPPALQTLDAGAVSIDLFTLLPITDDEMMLKLVAGAEALCDRLATAGVDDVVDPSRTSVLRRNANARTA